MTETCGEERLIYRRKSQKMEGQPTKYYVKKKGLKYITTFTKGIPDVSVTYYSQ